MLKRYGAKGLGLVLLTATGMLVGGIALAGTGSDSALAGPGTSTCPVITPATTSSQYTLEGRVVDMMQDHMGLTDRQAGDWAAEMVEHMQAVHGNQAGTLIDQMDRFHDEYFQEGQYGPGMMGDQYGSGMRSDINGVGTGNMMSGQYGTGNMMDVGRPSGPGGSATTVSNYALGSMMGGASSPAGTMMGGNQVAPGTMMGGTTTTTVAGSGVNSPTTSTTSTTQGSVTSPGPPGPGTMMGGNQAAPVTPGTPGTMMNEGTGTTSQATTPGMMGGGGMGSRR